MPAFLFDHLWQSLQFVACVAAFCWLTRNNGALFRLWAWRAAALKFLVPFGLFVSLGKWLGFPLTHTAALPLPEVVSGVHYFSTWFSPAWNGLHGAPRFAFAILLLPLTGAASWIIVRRVRAESARAVVEQARLEADPDDHPRGIGFFKAALMSAWLIAVVTAPILSGAVRDALRHHEHLIVDARAFRDAEVVLKPADPGMGTRHRLVIDAEGVFIRNVSLQELAAMAYGVTPYFVRNDQFRVNGQIDWLTGMRYDARIPGRVRDPEDFDAYALRQPVTRKLARDMGIEIYVNHDCQPPCGIYNVVMPASDL